MSQNDTLWPDDVVLAPYNCYSCVQCVNSQRVDGVFSCRVYEVACKKVKECAKYRYNRTLDGSKVGMVKER